MAKKTNVKMKVWSIWWIEDFGKEFEFIFKLVKTFVNKWVSFPVVFIYWIDLVDRMIFFLTDVKPKFVKMLQITRS